MWHLNPLLGASLIVFTCLVEPAFHTFGERCEVAGRMLTEGVNHCLLNSLKLLVLCHTPGIIQASWQVLQEHIRCMKSFRIISCLLVSPRKHKTFQPTMYYTEENQKSCDVVKRIQKTNLKFKKACKAIVLLNNSLESLQVRYNRARGSDRRSFRYNIRLRLCTVEGARNMFYEYASQQADEMEELQDKLITSEDEFYSSEGSVNSDSDDSQC